MKMKDSGVEWIGEIPEGWEVRPLKSIFSFGKGLPITKENLTEKGISVISYGQIHSKNNSGTKLQSDLFRYVDSSYLESGSNSLVNKGDFIFADTSEDLEGCGNCVYVDDETELFAGYHTVVLQTKESNENKYLAYLFKTDEWRKQIREKLVEVKLYSITRKVLKTTTVILPPKENQQKIATYLDEKCSQIEQTIQNQQQVIEKLKAYKQSFITEAVTGKVKIQNGKVAGKYEQYKDSGVEWIGEIPSRWSCAQLKNLYKFLGGFAFNSDDYVEESNNQVLRIGNVKDFKILFDSSPVYISNELAEKVDNFRLKPGYILFTMTGTRGKKDYFYTHEVNKNDCLKKNIYLNQRVGCLIPIANICSSFFNYLLKEKLIKDSVFLTETGTANQANIGSEDVMKTKVHLPPKEEQKSIAEYLDKTCATIDSAIEQKQKLIEKLTEYKKSLIYECVTGKKEIRK